MGKQVLIIGIIIILIFVGFSGCITHTNEQQLDEKLFGTWTGFNEGEDNSSNITYFFDKNGNLEIINQSIKYCYSKSKFSYKYDTAPRLTYWIAEKPNYKYICKYEFFNENTTVKLYFLNTTTVLTKQ